MHDLYFLFSIAQRVNYSNDVQPSFKYKLEGVDDDWTNIQSSSDVRFGSLAPGNYSFLLKATNRDRIWSAAQAEFNFTINPPWWKSALAFFMYFLSASLLFAGWYSNQKRKWKLSAELQVQLEKNATLVVEKRADRLHALLNGAEKERKRISRELHDGIGPILASASMMIESLQFKYKDLNQDSTYTKGKKLIDQSCEDVRNLSHELMPMNMLGLGFKNIMENLLDPMKDNGNIQVKLNYECQSEFIPTDFQVHIHRIIQELIKNVNSHADPSFFHLSIIGNSEQVQVEIVNDGKQYSMKQALQKNGLGMKNIIQRLEQMNAQYTFKTEQTENITYSFSVPLTAAPEQSR